MYAEREEKYFWMMSLICLFYGEKWTGAGFGFLPGSTHHPPRAAEPDAVRNWYQGRPGDSIAGLAASPHPKWVAIPRRCTKQLAACGPQLGVVYNE